jgi:hypothetical protein
VAGFLSGVDTLPPDDQRQASSLPALRVMTSTLPATMKTE